MPLPGEQYRATAGVAANPFEPAPIRVERYTATEIATLQARLDKQLGPEYISNRPGAGNTKVHYITAEKVINLANEVFGFNGWSSQIQNVQIDFVDDINGKISLGLSIVTRVTLRDGTFHEDIGYGHIENCKGKAAAFEKAKKEAATDALKRSLRNFGKVLGNCLYDKDYLSKVTKMKIQPSRWDPDNLHRHPDFAPETKQGPPPPAKKPQNVEEPARPVPQQESSSEMELEDEFGDNVFDGVEVNVTSPDEVVLQSLERQQPPIQAQVQSRGPIQGTHQHRQPTPSGPHTRQNGYTAPQQQNQQQPSRYPAPQAQAQVPAQAQAQATDTRVPVVGFVTSRAAEMLANGPPVPAVSRSLPAFNPKSESPSIRRSSGIDHSSSRPVSKTTLSHVEPSQESTEPPPQPQPQQTQRPQTRQQQQQQQQQPGPTEHARRIGMPGGGVAPSPLANRSSYKPPGPSNAGAKRAFAAVESPVPRSPLRDVSNVTAGAASVPTAAAGEGEAKKARTDAASNTTAAATTGGSTAGAS